MSVINQHVLVGCLRDGCVCSSEFGKCTRCYAADTIQALQSEVERLKGVLGEIADTLNRGPDSSQKWDVKAIHDLARAAQEDSRE